jgi:prepilin-type N-terminal cleavage/methylation domain-containing protein
MKNKLGFTLIEVLIVTVILSIISLAIFSTFSNGLKIYNRVNNEVTAEDLVIFCDRFGSDLRNSLNFTGIGFTGQEDQLAYASLFNSPRLQKRTVSRIKYSFDPAKNKIDRYIGDYPSVYSQEAETVRNSLDKVQTCIFSYYYFNNQSNEFTWLSEWNKDRLPLAVRMELELKDYPEAKIVRTFNIPSSSIEINETTKQ